MFNAAYIRKDHQTAHFVAGFMPFLSKKVASFPHQSNDFSLSPPTKGLRFMKTRDTY